MARRSMRGRTSTTPRSDARSALHQGIIWNISRCDNANSQLPTPNFQSQGCDSELGVGIWDLGFGIWDSNPAAVRLHILQELRNRRRHPLRWLHEFHTGPVGHDVLI